jgi:hypothetical protein
LNSQNQARQLPCLRAGTILNTSQM